MKFPRLRQRGSRGSNQYQTKPAAAAGIPRSDLPDLSVRFAVDEAEETAWAFHPDRDAWADAGILSHHESRLWVEAGVPVAEAQEWRWRCPDFTVDEVASWRRAGYAPHDAPFRLVAATRFMKAGYSLDEAIAWSHSHPDAPAHSFTPVQAALWRDVGFTAASAHLWASVPGMSPSRALQQMAHERPPRLYGRETRGT